MRQHLNTLFITTDGAWLRKDGANIVVEVERAEIGRVPIHMMGGIVCFGRVGMSPPLMGHCAESGVAVSFLSEHGKFMARVEGPCSGNVLLRRRQYRIADDPAAGLVIVRAIVAAKAANQRAVLRRALRDHGIGLSQDAGHARLDDAQRRLGDVARRVAEAPDIDAARGHEGDAANAYFGVFDHLVRRTDGTFRFGGRSRRPPLDPCNALLSFLYAILGHDCRSALESVGLDPQVGFLHRDRPGRASLALDLMEEFRSTLADRVALTLINRQQLGEKDFIRMDGGAVLLRDDSRKAVLTAYQERKKDEITHPFLNEKVSLGLVPHIQAQLLARHLRGDLDGYPPFLWK
ncbi:type I-C CRISPR-associated endonuclease Cas1c [Azospirillum brasilense]|uniref:type I-C CRISPR-associated endonuclease Cas1c n=1 Tax=Azospirillum brasilense TaxID=192 RepID=UPI000E67A7D1|nr:type I-C CRISPR-associated endonuclease Cas1c [Azospirillum brasilense]NUB27517.1 type I-C CRISPR-associated endonuclease Cas1 [Azospirillum brasilense]NUB31800.1 type I-C CRISPR-associated endonuclease Cas1 [Azospirillum brasilense]RIW04796.1 type I-C CRISPR-associated endonuclease Cas1 [Azospirillum brasilense]